MALGQDPWPSLQRRQRRGDTCRHGPQLQVFLLAPESWHGWSKKPKVSYRNVVFNTLKNQWGMQKTTLLARLVPKKTRHDRSGTRSISPRMRAPTLEGAGARWRSSMAI
mmetsp:Transcript_36553/g.73687  ORF Transcript_36553/g.73687 Transcript_36553/m.73687 type:complete len:109 (-) Transcript_36553:662-988(-)